MVWDAFRAEVRGREVTFAEPLGGEPIADVARSGDRWVFRLADGTLRASDTFLGAWTQVDRAAPVSGRARYGWGRGVVVHAGPLVWVDDARRAWRFDGAAAVPTGPSWPAHVFHLHFEGAREGLMAVDGPRWLLTRDGGASWSLARAPGECALPYGGRLPRAVPPPGDDRLRCGPARAAPPADERTAIGLRVAFALVAREPAYLPVLEPVQLDGETLVAFDGEHLVHYDAETWRERRRVPTTWPPSLTLRGRYGDDLWGASDALGMEFRLGADGSSRRVPRREPGSYTVPGHHFVREVHRVGPARGEGAEGADCYAYCTDDDHCDPRWRRPGGAPGGPWGSCWGSSILYGDRLVEVPSLQEADPPPVRSRRVSVEAGASEEPVVLHEGPAESRLRVTADERWLYTLTLDPVRGWSVAWGDAEEPWHTAPLPRHCGVPVMVTPERMLAICRDARIQRTSDGGATWEPVEGAAVFPGRGPDRTEPRSLCTARYCFIEPRTVLVSPWGPAGVAPTPAPPRPASSRPAQAPVARRAYACVRTARLPLPEGPQQSDDMGFVRLGSLASDERVVRVRLSWAGVDGLGTFTATRDLQLPPAFWHNGSARAYRVTRQGVTIAHGSPADASVVARVGRGGAPRFEISRWRDEAIEWLAAAGCPVRERPSFAWDQRYAPGPHLHRWAAHFDFTNAPPEWLFADADRCGAAVLREGEEIVALHGWWPSPEAEPARAALPDFARALPCRAPLRAGVTRWRVPGALTLGPFADADDLVAAEYESSRGGVCLRAASSFDDAQGVVVAAQPDGTLRGVADIDGDLWGIRCVAR